MSAQRQSELLRNLFVGVAVLTAIMGYFHPLALAVTVTSAFAALLWNGMAQDRKREESFEKEVRELDYVRQRADRALSLKE